MSADPAERSASRTTKRLIIAVGALLVVAVTVLAVRQFGGGGSGGDVPAQAAAPPPELTANDVTNQFLAAFAAGDMPEAARLTDEAPAATAQLNAVYDSLAPTSVTTLRSDTAPAADASEVDVPFTLTWTFAAGRTWQYQSGLHLVKKPSGWRVHWLPALVHPKLGPGQSLVMRDALGQPAVVDRAGAPLLTWTANGTAAVDGAVAPLLLDGMGRVAAEQGGAGGWYVALVDGAGNEGEVVQGAKTGSLVSTLSVPVQKAAQAAVDAQSQPAMLVAIQPSNGDILAVAQNSAAGADAGPLHGLYEPGSTFKIATAAAIVEAGIAGADSVVSCPGVTHVGQRTIENDNGFALGDVPLHTAFARSCNTTFAEQSASLAPGALSGAADQLGLGADFDIKGITTEAGSVPDPRNATEQAENAIGQGRVQVSCFGMALVATTVAAGEARTPGLWRDIQTSVGSPYQGPPAGVIASLRTMMREVVTAGTATGLAPYGKVFGKTGTAQFGDGTSAHGWFTGYRGDVAFATLVVGAGTSKTAVNVTGQFLGGLG